MSSTIVPSVVSMTVYLARPTVILEKSPASAVLSPLTASGPVTNTSPLWERSKMPTASRTAWGSGISEVYFSGLFQPLKSVKLAPSASWVSNKGVVFSVMISLLMQLEGFWWRAGADQIPVAASLIDPRYRSEVFIYLQFRYRKAACST